MGPNTIAPEFRKSHLTVKYINTGNLMKPMGEIYKEEVDYPLGDYRDPMDNETLYAKFDSMVLPITGKSKRDKIVHAILHLEQIDDVSHFKSHLEP